METIPKTAYVFQVLINFLDKTRFSWSKFVRVKLLLIFERNFNG